MAKTGNLMIIVYSVVYKNKQKIEITRHYLHYFALTRIKDNSHL